MIKNIENTELEEVLSLLSYYDNIEENIPESILEDINEEVHSAGFLRLISENNKQDI